MSDRKFRRVVVKIGTNAMMENGRISRPVISELARQLSLIRNSGADVILVTSGAIGFGIEKLGIGFPKDTKMRQAMAAIGQSGLMNHYEEAFGSNRQTIAQVLLTHDNIAKKESIASLTGTIEKLFSLGVIPIVNENDVVSAEALTAEKQFSDNDGLAAILAAHFNADLLVLLTDVDGIFTENPKDSDKAEKIRGLKHLLSKEVVVGSKSDYGLGGMNSKIMAAKKALAAGVSVAVCKARQNAVIDVFEGNCSGSFFAEGN